jgi:hypothetical protein
MRFFNSFKDRLIRDEARNKVDPSSLSPILPTDATQYIKPLEEKPNHRPDLKIPKHGYNKEK